MCPETMIDNHENNQIWWWEDAKGVSEIEHGHGTCAKTRVLEVLQNMKARDPHGKQDNHKPNSKVMLERAHMNNTKHKKSHMCGPHLHQSHA